RLAGDGDDAGRPQAGGAQPARVADAPRSGHQLLGAGIRCEREMRAAAGHQTARDPRRSGRRVRQAQAGPAMTDLFATLRRLAGKPLVRAAIETPFLRAQLARSRSAPVEGQVVDEALAAVLALDDLTHDSDHRGRTPVQARAQMRESVPMVDAESL